MRAGEIRSSLTGMLVLGVTLGALSGCATTSNVGYTEEPPSQVATGMQPRGKVVRVDEPQRVVVLDNGRMYRVTGNESVYVDGRPTSLRSVAPGSTVTIVNGTPVAYQNGQYVVVQPGSGAVAPGGVLTSPPAGTIVAAPPTAVVTTPPAGSAVRMYGRVADVEDNGNVKVRLPDGNAFEFRAPAGTVVRKGDPVTMDFTFGGVAPSASPR
jgi:hypothetical protein